MRIGKFNNKEPTIRFNLDLVCINCKTKVPGGVLTSKNYFGSYSFMLEIAELKKNYLCGKCRDRQRILDRI